jgi:uncharacterized protein (DUF697 family)
MAQKPTASVNPEKDEAVAATSSTSSDTSEMTPERRDEMASKLVDRFAIWSGVAGLIPVPIVDAVAVGGLQLQMLRRISQIYGVAFSENSGKALIASTAGSMIPATSGIGAASVLKAVPIVGTLVSGFVMPVLSAGATYAIGKAFIQHFASGGTLLDFNPPAYREFVKAQKQMWDSRSTKPSKSSSSERAEALREAELTDLKKQADDITSSVTDFTNFDPMANTQKEMERAFMPEAQKAAEPSAEAADLVRHPEPAAAAEPATPHLPIDVPLPEPSGSVMNEDFAPTEVPPPKQAGSGS